MDILLLVGKFLEVNGKRLKSVVDDTSGIGWGFHDNLDYMYYDIKWLDIEDIDANKNNLPDINELYLV